MDFDVVISGGGPVGLMLACELRLAGVDVLVVERLTEPDKTIKAGSVNVATAAAFDRRGLLPELAEEQRLGFERFTEFLRGRSPDAQPVRKAPIVGHFAGLMVGADKVDFTGPAFRNAGPAAGIVLVPQQAVERILGDRAGKLGAELWRGTELTGFEADDDGVTVRLGDDLRVRAGWLVGCDGGRSLVRKLGGFDFPGTGPEITGHQAIVDLDGAGELGTGWQWTPNGVYAHGPAPGRVLTVELHGPPADRDAPITAAELQASLRTVSGVDVTVTAVHSATRFTDNARQASTYRRGRVLLAGDAAHVHSPFGGQGLNLGIGDAVNLGWKLGANVAGRAPEGLLDTYTAERHPVGAWVLEWTRAQVALMRPDRRTGALREVVADLLGTRDGATFLAGKLSGLLHRYDVGGGHELTGALAPELELTDGSRLGEHCHEGRPVLFDFSGDCGQAARPWADRVDVVESGHPELAGLLVRPDGYVAWAAGHGTEGLPRALATWFGTGTP